MRDDGATARAADPAHRLGQRGPLHGHVAGAVVAQMLGEYGLHVGAVTRLDQITRKVGTADQFRVAGERQRAFVGAGHAHFSQALADALGAFGAARARLAQTRDQLSVLRIELQAHDMHRQARPRHRDFHAGGKPHAQVLRRAGGFGQAAHFVVIRQCPDVDAVRVRALRHVARRQRAVGHGGMAVQIDVQGGRFHRAIVEKPRHHE
ncbi:hypothetical protein D3C73_990900 [compost metagenome]